MKPLSITGKGVLHRDEYYVYRFNIPDKKLRAPLPLSATLDLTMKLLRVPEIHKTTTLPFVVISKIEVFLKGGIKPFHEQKHPGLLNYVRGLKEDSTPTRIELGDGKLVLACPLPAIAFCDLPHAWVGGHIVIGISLVPLNCRRLFCRGATMTIMTDYHTRVARPLCGTIWEAAYHGRLTSGRGYMCRILEKAPVGIGIVLIGNKQQSFNILPLTDCRICVDDSVMETTFKKGIYWGITLEVLTNRALQGLTTAHCKIEVDVLSPQTEGELYLITWYNARPRNPNRGIPTLLQACFPVRTQEDV